MTQDDRKPDVGRLESTRHLDDLTHPERHHDLGNDRDVEGALRVSGALEAPALLLYLGGICRTLRVVKMAQAADLPVTPHCANLSLVTLFTMHLLRAIPNAGKYLEFAIEGADYYPWQEDLFVSSPYEIESGHATVTDEPGWGVEINPEWLARSCYQISE